MVWYNTSISLVLGSREISWLEIPSRRNVSVFYFQTHHFYDWVRKQVLLQQETIPTLHHTIPYILGIIGYYILYDRRLLHCLLFSLVDFLWGSMATATIIAGCCWVVVVADAVKVEHNCRVATKPNAKEREREREKQPTLESPTIGKCCMEEGESRSSLAVYLLRTDKKNNDASQSNQWWKWCWWW